MAAAVRVIKKQGLSAPTAAIAKEAGVANGSLFTYFATKTILFNQLYLDLKTEMASAASHGLSSDADIRERFFRAWANWMQWAVYNPEKRLALALLAVSDEITEGTHALGNQTMLHIAALMEQVRLQGPMREVPFPFVAAVMNSLAEATMDFMIRDPVHADQHSKAGFDALWRMLS
jgi:AcrR family transcriptional regulator